MNDSSPGARVTIVMTARERHSLTESAIESVVAGTTPPYRLIYADVQSPAWLRERLHARAPGWNLEIARFDDDPWPNEVRHRLAPAIQTDYAVYIDNDVRVTPGWLDALVACADETGAGIVAPLYLWGDGETTPTIHMAGGRLAVQEAPEGTVMDDFHRHPDADPDAIAAQLRREPCDYAEYHCMLIRGDLVRSGEMFDRGILCVHEHIDTALSARRKGYQTYLEPSARITYLARAPYSLQDLPFFRRRWARDEGEASIAAFARKWKVIEDDRSFGRLRAFLVNHVIEVDPIRPATWAHADLGVPMQRHELAQSRSDLLDLARARGYASEELAFLAQAWHLALMLTDGGYRPCGRPFINHLVGTAGVLARYGFRAEVVAAGMLHAAYTHAPQLCTGPQASIASVCSVLGGADSPLERRVRAYTRRRDMTTLVASSATDAGLSLQDAEVVAIAAANEIDMLLSGEFRYAGRSDHMKPEVVAVVTDVCETLGVPGLARTLVEARRATAGVPQELSMGMSGSFRVSGYTLVPMTNDAFFALEAASGAAAERGRRGALS